jgi:hypothetical protein
MSRVLIQALDGLLDEIGRKVRVMRATGKTHEWHPLNIEQDALSEQEVVQFEGLLSKKFQAVTGHRLVDSGWRPFDEFVRTNCEGSVHDYWYWASLWVNSTRQIMRSLADVDKG